MLDGITVLNKIAETDPPIWSLWLLIGIFSVITIFGSLICIVGAKKKEDKILGSLVFAIIGIIFAACVCLPIDIIVKVPNGEYKYQVTIDSSVAFKEFDEKYYVINQEDEIYTIKEK